LLWAGLPRIWRSLTPHFAWGALPQRNDPSRLSWAVTRYETGRALFAIIGGLIGGKILPGKGSNKRTKRTEALWLLVGAMLLAVLFGGLLWGIGGSAAIAFAALGLIFAGLVAIYLYV
jgi:hypothetical protein